MKGSAIHLVELLEGAKKRFIIPVYQRNYDWTIDNCRQLYDDLVNMVVYKKPSHFFGCIVYCSHSLSEVVVIDGQQRITTISLLLIAMVNAIKAGLCFPKNSSLVEYINETFLIDKFQHDVRKVRLKPFREDCDAYDKLIYGTEDEYITDSKVTINYRYFYDRITEKRELTVDELNEAIEKLMIINVELELQHGDNPQLIFESLNSTGRDLSESDKIRNFVLMDLDPDLQELYYDKYWNKIEKCCGEELDAFVRNFLTIETKRIPTIKNIYPEFKLYAKEQEGIEGVLQEMLKYAEFYHKIVTCHVGDEKANVISKRLELLDITVAYPFLMEFLDYAETEDLSSSEIEKVFSCIETFIFRRLMCDYPTNALNKIFAHLHKSVIKNMKPDDTYSSVMIYLLENRRQSIAFPRNEEFFNALVTKNVYSMRNKNREYIFERLENMNSKEKNDIVRFLEEGVYSIEHIMPQTLSPSWMASLGEDYIAIHEKWLHTLPNLTLTAYNSKYSNRSFQEKKTMEDGFVDSGIRLNQYIAQFDQWTEIELEKRKDEILSKAAKLWPYPESDFQPEQKMEDIISLSDETSAPVGKAISSFVFRETSYKVNDWSDTIREVVRILFDINPAILYREAKDTNVWFLTKEHEGYNKIADNLYFTTHSSTANKMSIMKNLFAKYGIDEDELYFNVYDY